jgi:hypothetical protein
MVFLLVENIPEHHAGHVEQLPALLWGKTVDTAGQDPGL